MHGSSPEGTAHQFGKESKHRDPSTSQMTRDPTCEEGNGRYFHSMYPSPRTGPGKLIWHCQSSINSAFFLCLIPFFHALSLTKTCQFLLEESPPPNIGQHSAAIPAAWPSSPTSSVFGVFALRVVCIFFPHAYPSNSRDLPVIRDTVPKSIKPTSPLSTCVASSKGV